MFQKVVSKSCSGPKCETAKRGDVLDASLNLCEECGAELIPRKITDVKKLAVTAVAALVISGAVGYAAITTIERRLALTATEAAVRQLSSAYDPATTAKLRARVAALVQSRGHDEKTVSEIVNSLKAETQKALGAPEFREAVRLASQTAADATDRQKRLDAALDAWVRQTGVSRKLLLSKAEEIIASRDADTRNLTRSIELAANGDPLSGIADLQKAVQRDSDNPWIQANLCAAYLRAERRAVAAESCRTSLRLQPSNWLAHYNLACIYAQEGNVDAALQELSQALMNVESGTTNRLTKSDLIARMKSDSMLATVSRNPKFRKISQ